MAGLVGGKSFTLPQEDGAQESEHYSDGMAAEIRMALVASHLKEKTDLFYEERVGSEFLAKHISSPFKRDKFEIVAAGGEHDDRCFIRGPFSVETSERL